jgi:uncharacterized protein
MDRRGGSRSVPLDSQARLLLLDSLRGWALLGILIANMMAFTGFYFIPDAEREANMLLGRFDNAAELLIEWLVVGKFYALFSLLFGIGFAIQLRRLEQRGEGAGRYLRRLAVLFLIGLAHMLLLWMGDILALYALMGAVLLLFRQVSNRALLWWSAALWLVPILWSAAIHFAGFQPAAPFFQAAVRFITSVSDADLNNPLAHFASSDLVEHLRTHPGEMFFRLADLVYQMRFTKVLGMFLIGLWVGRLAIHADPQSHHHLLVRTAWVGIGVGLPLSLVRAISSMWPQPSPRIEFASEIFYCLGTPILALGYAAAFTLLWIGHRRRIAEIAAPAGQMALTNYLMQSVFQSALFYGWGLGLIGDLGLVFIAPLAAAIFAMQIAYSRWWLARYRFGPVEWLWRTLTYGQVQPMRRSGPRAAA